MPSSFDISYIGDFNFEVQLIKDFTIGIRSLRKNLMIPPGEKIIAYCSSDFENNKFLDENKFIIERLCNLKSLNVLENTTDMKLISNLTLRDQSRSKKIKIWIFLI